MKYAVVISEQDPAGLNIKEKLLELCNFKETGIYNSRPVYTYRSISLYSVDQQLIFADNLDIGADYFIFASKHKSESGNPAFCVHPIGNWGKAEYGGKDNTLCPSMPFHMKAALIKLNELNNLDFEVTMEVTHHGPCLNKPAMFIEIGSAEEQWKDQQAGIIIAKAILETIGSHYVHRTKWSYKEMFYISCTRNPKRISLYREQDSATLDSGCTASHEETQNVLCTSGSHKPRSAIILGGTHYNHAANKAMLTTDIAIGHICPKHSLEYLSHDILIQAITGSDASLILIDWKGLGQYKNKVIQLASGSGIEIKKTRELWL